MAPSFELLTRRQPFCLPSALCSLSSSRRLRPRERIRTGSASTCHLEGPTTRIQRLFLSGDEKFPALPMEPLRGDIAAPPQHDEPASPAQNRVGLSHCRFCRRRCRVLSRRKHRSSGVLPQRQAARLQCWNTSSVTYPCTLNYDTRIGTIGRFLSWSLVQTASAILALIASSERR
jgi:hypothetical protein